MNAKQKIHQASLNKWNELFLDQAASGLTVKDWCAKNNISIHKYNYWKHAAREAYVDSILPDIVPLPASQAVLPVSETNPSQISLRSSSHELYESHNSHNSLDLYDTSSAPKDISEIPVTISLGDIRIEIGPSASDEVIASVIKAVRHV